MSKSTPPSTQATWPYTERTVGSSHASALPGAWARIVTGLRTYRAARAEQRRLRRARHELDRLDDRMLKDIGISRTEIGRAVQYGRDL